MATLYKRATPAQHVMLRMIEGAVRNAADCHPEITIPPTFARSVAKRAAGTISSQWRDVLAANAPSDQAGVLLVSDTQPGQAQLVQPAITQQAQVCKPAKGSGRFQGPRLYRGGGDSTRHRSPLTLLWIELSAKLWRVKDAGDTARAEVYIEVLKMIAKHEPVIKL